MPIFRVTTAITAYETYVVSAEDEADARGQVADERTRAALALSSRPAGHGDDEEIIEIKEVA